jgi:outer membrane biosynthesis protein TonB
MSNYLNMSPLFEREKNIKAITYTATVCVLLFIVFFFVQWQLPVIPPPPVEEGIEVNLGNSDEGLGDIAPMIPGEQSSDPENNYSPPATSQAQPQEENITGDENETEDVPAVRNEPKPIVRNKPVPVNPSVNNKPKPNTTPVTNPTPVPPSPKAVYKGGTKAGPGGNNADSYNGVNNQGIAGGKGDQGNPNGNPNSDSYKGNASSGNSGVKIRSGLGGRRFTKLPSFEDEFNENAKVAVDIVVDRSGNVTSASVNPRGTTTTNANIRAIATRKARQLKLNAGSEDEQTGTILFDFKLRG